MIGVCLLAGCIIGVGVGLIASEWTITWLEGRAMDKQFKRYQVSLKKEEQERKLAAKTSVDRRNELWAEYIRQERLNKEERE